MTEETLRRDVVVVGGGLGGVAAALSAARFGSTVVLVESDEWLGGQLTTQGVPPDEHPWVEGCGITATYREFRNRVRQYYRRNYPLTRSAFRSKHLNPGAGTVSKLCHEPQVAVAVLEEMFAPWVSTGAITVLKPFRLSDCYVDGDRVNAIRVRSEADANVMVIEGDYFLDATETGDLLPLAGIEYVTGAESSSETGEAHAPPIADPSNMQAISHAFAIDHVDGDHTIDKPALYDHWSQYKPPFWGGPLLGWISPDPRTLEPVHRRFEPNPSADPSGVIADQEQSAGDTDLWLFRRMIARLQFESGRYASDICLVNWAAIDYFEGPVVDVDERVRQERLDRAKQLSLSMLYWMQTEAPRPDGGVGWPGLRLRPDVMGTSDGLARAPYIREGRRIRALHTITERWVSLAERGSRPMMAPDSVGVGMYRIDLHPSTGGDNYIDIPAGPFEIPLRSLIPQRVRNVIAAAKNIGTTHITNGCYRMHPVEWNIGEAAGGLAAFCQSRSTEPHAVASDVLATEHLQSELVAAGVELRWPADLSGGGY